jgi:hypothetical protein
LEQRPFGLETESAQIWPSKLKLQHGANFRCENLVTSFPQISFLSVALLLFTKLNGLTVFAANVGAIILAGL